MLSHLKEFPALSITAKSYLICSVLYTLLQVLKRQKEKTSVKKIILCDSKWKLTALQPSSHGAHRPVPPGTAEQHILLLRLHF